MNMVKKANSTEVTEIKIKRLPLHIPHRFSQFS